MYIVSEMFLRTVLIVRCVETLPTQGNYSVLFIRVLSV